VPTREHDPAPLRCVRTALAGARDAVLVARCEQTVRSVARSIQTAMPFGQPVFEVPPLCQANEPRASVHRIARAGAREIVHTYGDVEVGTQDRPQAQLVLL
jgi:hypothetical protein